MSSKKPIPAFQEMFRDFNSGPWAPDVPDHHKEILEELRANS